MNLFKHFPWNKRRIAEVTEAISPTPLPHLSDKSIEDMLIALNELRDTHGLRVQIPITRILRDEFLDQIASMNKITLR